MACRRNAPELVANGGRHRTEVPLPREQFSECVADVDHTDVDGGHARRSQRAVDDLPRQVGEVGAFTSEVAREIRLVAAEDPDVRAVHGQGLYYD
jgi:hypothetical protein